MKLPKALSLYTDLERAEFKVEVCKLEIEKRKEFNYDYLTSSYVEGRDLDEDDMIGRTYMLHCLKDEVIRQRRKLFKTKDDEDLPF